MSRYADMARRMSHFEILQNINEHLKKVYEVYVKLQMDNPDGVSSEMVADRLGVPLHYISPRTLELKDLGLIEEVGEGKNKSGRKCALHKTIKINSQLKFNFSKDDIECCEKRSRRTSRHTGSILQEN